MELKISTESIERTKTEALVLPLYENEKTIGSLKIIDNLLNNSIQKVLDSKEFKAELNETYLLQTYGKIPAHRIVLVGLGKRDDFKIDRTRQIAGTSALAVRSLGMKTFSILLPEAKFPIETNAQALTEGILLGLYQFTKFKTEEREKIKEVNEATILCSQYQLEEAKKGIHTGKVLSEAANYAREIANEPSNEGTPAYFARLASELAGKYALKLKVLDKDELKKLGFNALLAVGSGSVHEPKLIVLEYNHEKKPNTFAVVGKTITFDSGGICIKPEDKMDEMKFDKAGGAAVLGIIQACAELKIPVHVVGVIPAAENMPSGSAYRPGDILKSYSGKTIEIKNTDAEGRVALADALAYTTSHYKPKAIIDMATLTGACVVALGSAASGAFTNNQELLGKVKDAASSVHERVWELPLFEDYDEVIKSDVADVKNLGTGGAGACTAAAFLKKFIGKTPWVHLDIAGTGWITDKPKQYLGKGATGVGVRLIVELLRKWGK